MTFYLWLSNIWAQGVLVMGTWWYVERKKSNQKGCKQGENQGKHGGVKLAGLGEDSQIYHHLKEWEWEEGFRSPASLPHSMAQWWEDQWDKIRRADGRRWKREESDVHVTITQLCSNLPIPPTSGGMEICKKEIQPIFSGKQPQRTISPCILWYECGSLWGWLSYTCWKSSS